MRAAVLTGYGGVERLEVREVERPEPGPGQLLVRVRAAAVNPIDWKIRQGRLRLLLPAKFPLILGFDIAGEVAAVGPEVAELEPGDAVYAMLDSRHGGGYAEYAVVGQAAVAPKPEGLSFEEAAAVPLAALTALQALREVGDLQRGGRVAVNGAAGGVGHFAVQIAVALGARVTGVAGPRNQDFVRQLGAERAVDYTRDDFMAPASPDDGAIAGTSAFRRTTATDATGEAGKADANFEDGDANAAAAERGQSGGIYDVIFDAAGVLRFADCEPALEAGGVYVTTRRGPAIFIAQVRAGLSRLLDRGGARRAGSVSARPDGEDLTTIARLVDRGRLIPRVDVPDPLRPRLSLQSIDLQRLDRTGQAARSLGFCPAIDHVYSLDEVRQAHAASESGHTRGKLVLRIDA